MLTFLLFSLLCIASGNLVLKFFFEMSKTGGALDIMFGWQAMLERLYAKGSLQNKSAKFYMWAESALGGCEKCTSFWFMPLWYICYYITSKFGFHMWVTDGIQNWGLIIFVNWFWYSIFHSIGAATGYFTLIKLLKKQTNVV